MRIALFVFVLAVATAFSTNGPRLTVASTDPFVVRGSSFVPGESVRVSVTGKTAHVRVVQVRVTGTFVVRFGKIALGRCGSYFVRARGDHGSAAATRFIGECAQLQSVYR
jgi:hypothetical protein